MCSAACNSAKNPGILGFYSDDLAVPWPRWIDTRRDVPAGTQQNAYATMPDGRAQ